MSIREQINKRPLLGYAGAILVLTLAAMSLRSYSRSRAGTINTNAYFTADDGKTTFIDSMMQSSPFRLPDGREAVLAHVFAHKSNDHFVAYLERNDGDKLANVQRGANSSFVPASLSNRVVKRPGDNQWIAMTNPEAMKIINVRNSDGSQADEVAPQSR